MRRLPVYLLIDCSESMAGPAIDSVNEAVQSMVQDLRSTPHALETVAMSLIAFSGDARLVVPLTPIDMFQLPALTIRPGTSLGRALDLLASCISTDVVKTTQERKGDWRPLVFLFTDGQPTDDWRGAAERIKVMASPRIANIYAIGCGDDVDFSVLHEITDIVFKTAATDTEAIRKAFVWITASVQSASMGVAEGADRLPKLEADFALKEVPKGEYVQEREPRQVFIHAKCSTSRGDYLMRLCESGRMARTLRQRRTNWMDTLQVSVRSSRQCNPRGWQVCRLAPIARIAVLRSAVAGESCVSTSSTLMGLSARTAERGNKGALL